ncbi:MAG: hypothetical protein WB507_08960 [Solirubrobacterales bacterium]
MRKIRSNLTYANVIATLALFIAIGGASAFAASSLAKNTVGTKQIKNQAVTAAKIKKGTITGSQVKSGSLTGTQINLSTLGPVPSATRATTATAASIAENADNLDGQSAAQIASAAKLHCATGMQFSAGVCIEESPQPSEEWLSAVTSCAEKGFRLPSLGELMVFEGKLSTEPPGEWTEGESYSGTEALAVVAAAAEHAFSVGFDSTGNSNPYRCVTPASN